MKKYRDDTETARFITGWEAICMTKKETMKRTQTIVWIGSSQYWSRVYLNTLDHKLYAKTDKHTYEALETLNIRKIETI